MSTAPKTRPESESQAGITIQSTGTSRQSDSDDFSGLQILGITSINRLLDPSGKEVTSGESELFDAKWQGRRVVIKWFHYGKKPKPDVMGLIAKLDHKCVVDILETGICSERAYEILEFIEHGDLNQWQQKSSLALQDPSIKSGLPENKIRQVLEELTNAVESLHQIDIIHRDIKPANVLVRSEDPLDLVLADFGISSLTELSLHQTSRDRTAAYSAPEAMTGNVCKASDWWSVGAVVLKLLTGREPFDGVALNTIDFILVRKGLEIPADLPERWKLLLSGLLCKDCSERWGTAEVRDWLAGKELMPPLGSRLGSLGSGGELQTAVPYTFKNEKFFAATPLAHALARNWKEGLKHYGRGLIFRWLENDLKDAEKVVQISEFAEDTKLTAEMKFALALNVLDPKLQLSWRGEVINAAFAHSNGEILWLMVEAGMLGHSRGHEVFSMAEERRKAYLDRIEGNKAKYDQDLAKKLIGAPEERIIDQALERADQLFDSLQSSGDLPKCFEEFPDFKTWFSADSLGVAGNLALISCKPKYGKEVFLPILLENALQWISAEPQASASRWQKIAERLKRGGWDEPEENKTSKRIRAKNASTDLSSTHSAVPASASPHPAPVPASGGDSLISTCIQTVGGIVICAVIYYLATSSYNFISNFFQKKTPIASSKQNEVALPSKPPGPISHGQDNTKKESMWNPSPTPTLTLTTAPTSRQEIPPQRPISQTQDSQSPNTTLSGTSSSEVLSFQKALDLANRGDARAQAIVSIYYQVGYKTRKDISKASEYAMRSAKQHNPLGMYRLAVMMENGEGFEKNVEQGRRLKELSFEGLNAIGEDPYALTAIGIMLFRGEGGLTQNRAEALRLYKKAADMGYAPAQYNYSAALALGQGIAKNEGESLKWWQRAYDQDYPPAMSGPVGQVNSKPKQTERQTTSRNESPQPTVNKRLPRGIPVSGRPGSVASPYAPGAGLVDARGVKSGETLICPFTRQLFLMP